MHPKITYPAFFEGGLVGCKVNAPIAHREAFLFVPYSAIMSYIKCLKDPEISHFYEENPKIFGEGQRDWIQLILATYLMY